MYRCEDFARVPKNRRRSALELRVPVWSPFERTGHHCVWSGSAAMVWLWNAEFPVESAVELVERLTRTGTEEDAMTVTVLEERLQRQLRRVRRDGEAWGIERSMERGIERGVERGMERGIERGMERGLAGLRDVLSGQVARKFGPDTGSRIAGLLAEIADLGDLQRVGDWIVDCETGAELIARFDNATPGA